MKTKKTKTRDKRQASKFQAETATKRASRLQVNYDGSPLTESQIFMREIFAKRKELSTR